MMTLRDALVSGYSLGDAKWARGYVSRKVNVLDQPVKTAGGVRSGQMYVEIPSLASTRYLVRQYLIREV